MCIRLSIWCPRLLFGKCSLAHFAEKALFRVLSWVAGVCYFSTLGKWPVIARLVERSVDRGAGIDRPTSPCLGASCPMGESGAPHAPAAVPERGPPRSAPAYQRVAKRCRALRVWFAQDEGPGATAVNRRTRQIGEVNSTADQTALAVLEDDAPFLPLPPL
jgi:hypothetical protein